VAGGVEGTALKPSLIPPGVPLMVPLMVPLNPPDKRHPLRGTPPVRSSGTKVRRSVHSAHAPPRAKLPTQTWGNTMGRILPLRYPVCVPRPCYARSRTGRFAGAPGCLMHGLRRGYWVRDGGSRGVLQAATGPIPLATWGRGAGCRAGRCCRCRRCCRGRPHAQRYGSAVDRRAGPAP